MTHSLEPGGFSAESTSSSVSTWHWRLQDAEGEPVTVASVSGAPRFPSQSDAESWLGEIWRDLLREGVDAVVLFEEQREVYGPMSLHSTVE